MIDKKKRPRYVTVDKDRHGNDRHYFRRPGQPKQRLRSDPYTPEYYLEAAALLLGTGHVPDPVQTKAPVIEALGQEPGSLHWLVRQYEVRARDRLQPDQMARRIRLLTEICELNWPLKSGKTVKAGNLPFTTMQKKHVTRIVGMVRETPGARNNALKTMSAMFGWAIDAGELENNPAAGVRKERSGDGFAPVTVEQIRKYEATHPVGTMANLAMRLALYTGLRRGDLCQLGPKHMVDGRIIYKPSKTRRSTGVVVNLPVLPPLREAIDAAPAKGDTFILSERQRPFTNESLGMRARKWFDEAGLTESSLHGLRKAGPTIAAQNGATHEQLKAIWGWVTDHQASNYIKSANRVTLANQGMAYLTLDDQIVPPV